jgi:site-specific recombinase XerD
MHGRRAGVPWVSWHVLRHTAVTSWFRAGWNPKVIQIVAGHHAVSFTLDRYTHLIESDLPDGDTLMVGNG